MNIGIVLLSVGVVVAVLANDLGRRSVNRRRLVRPLIISAVVAVLFIGAPASGGTGLLLEAAGVVAGLAVGSLAALTMRVERDGSHLVTVAGTAYAAAWVGLAAARLAVAWAAQNLFPATMGHWLAANQVSAAAFTDAFILFAICSVVARTASIALRGRSQVAGGHLVAAL